MTLRTLIASTALAAAIAVSAGAANATTYTSVQSIDGETADISITTDSTLGLLSYLDTHITAYEIDLLGPVGNFFLSPADGQPFYVS